MSGDVITDIQELTFKAPLPGHFLGQFLNGETTTGTPLNGAITLSSTSGGRLDVLPDEIKLRIVSFLDLYTVRHLRLANSRLQRLVDTNLDFITVQAFPKLLAAVYVLNCRYYTLEHLAAAVRRDHCSRCQSYGDYLYLLTAERICYHCFRESPEYAPKAIKPVSPSILSTIEAKVLLAIVPPGVYGMHGIGRPERPQTVVDRRALSTLGAGLRQHQREPDECSDECSDESDSETARQGYLSRTSLNHASQWATAPLPSRYTVVLPAPYWDAETQQFHEGVFCKACAMSAETQSHPPRWRHDSLFWDYPYRRYPGERGIRRHIEECGAVRKVVTPDGHGIKYVHESAPRRSFVRPDEVCRCAGIFNRYRDGTSSGVVKPEQPAMERTLKSKKTANAFGRQHSKVVH
ncbi:putative F-box domain-containing protein [Seiridium unicorne]|uniref:F-box domain-containing protein n=1 Tax=Seiridium unicorne TaxID=138068 RepID=A0ABR2UMU9_9PEZI